ncbi:MAG: reverse transcriptase domain-containing protein, partial [Candidatus Fonsibacter sp.]
LCPDNLCVARPVGKHEIERTPVAKLAMKKEWDRLRSKHVWDEDHPRDWDEVRSDARRGGYTVHMRYLFGICVEKNAELDPSLRRFKGRVVFQGNQVYDQDHNYAIFQDLGSSLATLQAAKAVAFYGCLPDHCIEVADAEQAYIQADMHVDPTWICLPPEARPEWWKKLFPHLRRPVCLLKKALYGHPDAGTYWEKKCDAHIKSVGFAPIGPEWPSCYYNAKLSLMLSVYVDDFKLAGPKNNILVG